MSYIEGNNFAESVGESPQSTYPQPVTMSKDSERFFALTFNSNGADLSAETLSALLSDAAGASVAVLSFQE